MSQAHVSINVSNLQQGVEFYRQFLGVEPARQERDYAKFERSDPPLVLSLEPVYQRSPDSFNHLGIRLGSKEAVLAAHARLSGAGSGRRSGAFSVLNQPAAAAQGSGARRLGAIKRPQLAS